MFRLLLCGFLCSAAGWAQDVPYLIHPEKVQFVEGIAGGAIMNTVYCDAHGDLYFRYYDVKRASSAPVVRITHDGHASSFQFAQGLSEDLKDLRMYQLAISGSMLYMVGLDSDGHPTVIRFTSDGKYEGAVRLDQKIAPSAIAVLSSGQMFVLGTRRTSADDAAKPEFEAALGLYDVSGRLVKNVDLNAHDLDLNNPKGAGLMPLELALLDAESDAAYLVFHTAEPKLYVISAGGEVSRTLPLWNPGKEFTPSQLRLGGGQLLLEFTDVSTEGGGSQFRYVSYSSLTGERTGYYYAAPGTTGTLGCYDWRGGFTFLTKRNGQRAIQSASAR